MYVGDQSILPRYAPAAGLGACQSVGAVDWLASPALATIRMAKNPACNGLGQVTDVDEYGAGAAGALAGGTMLVVFVGLTVLAGFLSYQAGKAMTPPGSKKTTWGWIGVPVGMFTGASGLGVMGWVSNARKR
jgi:hypothetical protein